MYLHTYTDEDDTTVEVTLGRLKLSDTHTRALRLVARAWRSNHVPPAVARLIEQGVQYCRFQAIFMRPFNKPEQLTIRGFGIQYHSAEDPRKSYSALTVYILGSHNEQGYVAYGNLTLDPVGNAIVRPHIRCTPEQS